MVQFTVSGESIAEIDEQSNKLHRAKQLAENDLLEVFEDVIEVNEILKELTEDFGSVRRNKIEDKVDGEVYQSLQLLQAYGYATSGGQGGNWKYTGN